MEQIEFPQDFSEFLKLLNAHHVEYLLGGVSMPNESWHVFEILVSTYQT